MGTGGRYGGGGGGDGSLKGSASGEVGSSINETAKENEKNLLLKSSQSTKINGSISMQKEILHGIISWTRSLELRTCLTTPWLSIGGWWRVQQGQTGGGVASLWWPYFLCIRMHRFITCSQYKDFRLAIFNPTIVFSSSITGPNEVRFD